MKQHWRKMWAHFSLKSDDFLARYHRRSNVESTMWMIKSKFGGSVRSKLATAQVNEVLCKVLCHNLTCIIHAVAEFGIDVDFLKPAPTARPNLTLVSGSQRWLNSRNLVAKPRLLGAWLCARSSKIRCVP